MTTTTATAIMMITYDGYYLPSYERKPAHRDNIKMHIERGVS